MESVLSLAETGNDNTTSAAHSVSEDHAEWCRREHVDEKDCAKWVARQMGDMAGAPVTEDQAERCRHEYVDPWACAKWVADQTARKAADETQRKEEDQQRAAEQQPQVESVLSLAEADGADDGDAAREA